KIFDITFLEFLNNGDTITIYTKSSNPNIIKLCKASTICNENNLGTIIYDGTEGEFSFTIQNLQYPEKTFSIITSETTKIDFINSSKGQLINAQYDPNDKTSKVVVLDGDDLDIDDDEIFNIIFEQEIKNGDIITLYLDDKKPSNIFICQPSDFCSENNYGTIYFPDIEGWYNITVSNLPHPTNTLAILNDDKLDLDYIKIYRTNEISNSETNLTYFPSTITTPYYTLNSDTLTGIFSSEENLNDQQILYYYSLDGNDYDSVFDNNISLNNALTISFKAELLTNGISTPTLTSLSLNYDYDVPCIEDWQPYYLGCLSTDKRLKYYIDENSCETILELPLDNSTYEACDYIVSTKFIGTNLTSEDLTNIENLTLEIENTGLIQFSEPVSITNNLDLDSNIEITNTSFFLNSTALPSLNKSAKIQLKNLNFNNPIILMDNTTCSSCNKLNYENNILTFTVPHFTLYTIEEGPYCGDGICQESCSSCSSDCGSCPSSSTIGSGGSKTFTRPSPTVVEAPTVIEEPAPETIETQETINEPEIPEYIEQTETSTLESFTGAATQENLDPKVKRTVNWSLIAVILLNIFYITKRYYKRKNKPFPFVEDISKFGIK
ncbi:MAG: hypothetical protein KKG75_03445, partial [Nanoarchaeota archaeon]|nr:hypothetical protein [Nanoarchaeota archaeon]